MPSKPTTSVGQTNLNGLNGQRTGIQGLTKILLLVVAQISHVAAAPVKQFLGLAKAKAEEPEEDVNIWLYLAFAAVLVLVGGAFAGLTIA